jgi:hypothetical protein
LLKRNLLAGFPDEIANSIGKGIKMRLRILESGDQTSGL